MAEKESKKVAIEETQGASAAPAIEAGSKGAAPRKAAAKKTAKKGSAQNAAPTKGSANVGQYALLKRPIITEKTAMLSVDRDRVVFKVPHEATKTEIRKAVEAIYGVQVAKVRTANILGKVKRAGSSIGRRQGYKKAYVTIKKGQTIDVVEGL